LGGGSTFASTFGSGSGSGGAVGCGGADERQAFFGSQNLGI